MFDGSFGQRFRPSQGIANNYLERPWELSGL
jgi:hypothetical protein